MRRALIWITGTVALLLGAYLLVPKPPTDSTASLAHADHTPRHGGIFFMAPNGFHHLEGTLRDGRFRLYLYDNFTRPLDVRPFRARVGTQWLVPEGHGEYLTLPVDDATTTPPQITVFIRLGPDGSEDRFDFIFLPETLPS